MPWFTSSCGRIELRLTLPDALGSSHPGRCDADVSALALKPYVAKQLAAIDPEALRQELRGYGAWDDEELADHAQNLQRILWSAACSIVEEQAHR